MTTACDEKKELLNKYFGHKEFRAGQEVLIDTLSGGRDVLGIMPTGAGKSVCYQIPALLFDGVTLVVSPLISLMKDQVTALVQSGVRAAFFNSSLTDSQYRTALQRAYNGAYKIIYVAPERLLSEGFLNLCDKQNISIVAVDEAHCVSQWGQDFRPSYLKIPEFIEKLPKRPVVGAFTATATPNVKDDICRLLKLNDPYTLTTGYDSENLFFEVRQPEGKNAELISILEDQPNRSGIVYCATRKTVESVCELLCEHGFAATRYHAGLGDEERRRNQEDFIYDRKSVMVATNAFGMGIDKSNISFVIHYNMPKNIESYYQEAGRAGRDGSEASCILLYGKQDVVTNRFLIEHNDNPDLDEETQMKIRKADNERLRQMTFYCTTPGCLRAKLLRYFGERAPDKCEKCSGCTQEKTDVRQTAASNIKTNKKSVVISDTRVNLELFNSLKMVRSYLAKLYSVPPYVIFTDATLADMCRKLPTTREALEAVQGVGEYKLKKYGENFIRIIVDYVSSADITVAEPDEDERGEEEKPAPRQRTAPVRAGAKWTDEEDQAVAEAFSGGIKISQIARDHGRTSGSIRARLIRLGLIEETAE